jgi:hypothetical protein
MFRNFFEILGGVKLVICLNPAASEFNENLDVLNFAEAAQAIVCKREIKEDIQEDFEAREKDAANARAKKNKRKTIFQPWEVNEDVSLLFIYLIFYNNYFFFYEIISRREALFRAYC